MAEGITQEDLKLFLQEADEQIQLLDEDIVRLEREADNADLLQEIFRAAHTLKGSSAMVGHQRMAGLAHAMENVLDMVRKRTLPVSPGVVDALLSGLDVMRALKGELVSPGTSETDIGPAVAELGAAASQTAAAAKAGAPSPGEDFVLDKDSRDRLREAMAEGLRSYDVTVAIKLGTDWASIRCFQVIQALSPIARIIHSVPSQQEIEECKAGHDLRLLAASARDEAAIREAIVAVEDIESLNVAVCGAAEAPAPLSQDHPSSPVEAAPPENHPSSLIESTPAAKKQDSVLGQTVRVDVSRLDSLMDQVGELVINRNRISQIGKTLGEKYRDDEMVRDLVDTVSQVGKIVGVLQQDIMGIRMLPIEIVFNTMPRMVRDLARKMDKKVDFVVVGQETEVDRSVIEHLRDPLIHLLRNSVDHGIESPEERRLAGKPEMGTIKLSAYHEQDNIIIVVEDDGKGLDPETIRKAAVKKGIISAEAAAALSDGEATELIFASGVSTAGKVTEVSGRGVGLDVVRTNVELLHGSISVHSTVKSGTRITLTLPLTLAIIPALLVSVARTVCAIPLSSIMEAGKLDANDIKTVRGKEVTLFRGNVLPLLRLSRVFGWETEEEVANGASPIVIVKVAGMNVGIIVDSLVGEQEIVAKSLELTGGTNGISGVSILGDGKVVLILDVASLIRGTDASRVQSRGKPGAECTQVESVSR